MKLLKITWHIIKKFEVTLIMFYRWQKRTLLLVSTEMQGRTLSTTNTTYYIQIYRQCYMNGIYLHKKWQFHTFYRYSWKWGKTKNQDRHATEKESKSPKSENQWRKTYCKQICGEKQIYARTIYAETENMLIFAVNKSICCGNACIGDIKVINVRMTLLVSV